MVKIYLDTNTILDILCRREPFYIDSAKIWTLIKEKIIEGFISAITVNNIYYIVRKLKDRKTAEAFIDIILNDFEIVPLTKDILIKAKTVSIGDYEDLIQYFSAISTGCTVLITRNKKDFPPKGIDIFSPTEFVNSISSF